jgi:predicted nucleotidyltransferase
MAKTNITAKLDIQIDVSEQVGKKVSYGAVMSAVTEATTRTGDLDVDVIERLLRHLSGKPYADKITVFGSVARVGSAPRDLDVVLDLGPGSDPYNYMDLLALARKFYGSFDPFIRAGRILYARNDEATGWIRAKQARAIQYRQVSGRMGKPLQQVYAKVTQGQNSPT